jgi:DNA repair protein RadC
MPAIKNYTNVETIYKKSVRTVKLRLKRSRYADLETELQTIGSPDDVYTILRAVFDSLDVHQEHLILLVVNTAGDVTGFKVISSGSQDSGLVDCKVLFRNALLLGARSIIIAHNHPSGNLKPSTHDLSITKTVAEAGRIIDIHLLDHIIYTENGYTSLRETHPDLFYRIRMDREM